MDSSAILVERELDESYISEDEEIVFPSVKRKRTSTNYAYDDGYIKQGEEPATKKAKAQKIRGVIIGVWTDSNEPIDDEKHVIYGFIDIHDRLRTRIYGMNRRGDPLIGNMPMGAGGCWVTFERIIFEPHLKGLNPAEVKEYVKLRSDDKLDSTPEERQKADLKAVEKAKTIVAAYEKVTTPKAIVHRPVKKASTTNIANRTSLPRQSLSNTPSFKAINSHSSNTPSKGSPLAESKPSGVLLGYWAESDQHRPEDKHAVYGVLGGSDCFRVKVQKITRDGRYVEGNFPVGAGAMWLHYDKVVLDPQFEDMNRAEVKEYVRIRQAELEHKESEKERKMNETRAIRKAKDVVAQDGAKETLSNGLEQRTRGSSEILMEVRHSARSEHRAAARNQAEMEATVERLRQGKVEAREARELQLAKSRKEVAAAAEEQAQTELKNNLKKLNKVWVAQQRVGSGSISNSNMITAPATAPLVVEEIKYHNGIKYERKQAGPFQGKLVSAAQILSIDGEDYVEYRVLTKPSF